MTQEQIEDEIKDTENFRESLHQMIVEIDELSTQINWKRPEIQISQFLSLTLVRLLKVLESERENCRRLTLRNSMLIPFSFNPSGTHLQVQSMTTLVYQMLTNSII